MPGGYSWGAQSKTLGFQDMRIPILPAKWKGDYLDVESSMILSLSKIITYLPACQIAGALTLLGATLGDTAGGAQERPQGIPQGVPRGRGGGETPGVPPWVPQGCPPGGTP